jgi:membrane-associated phospholipid phosphatase
LALRGRIKYRVKDWPAEIPAPYRYTAIGGLVIFCLLMALVLGTASKAMDDAAFNAISYHRSPSRTQFMLFITYFGNHKFLIPANLLMLTFLLIKKQNAWGLLLVFGSLGGLFLELMIKQIVHRIRPGEPLIIGGVHGLSFASGHALMSSVYYGFLIYYGYNHVSNKWIRRIIAALLILFILTISFSRIYLRLHFLSDVLAGLTLGFAWLISARMLLEIFREEQLKPG